MERFAKHAVYLTLLNLICWKTNFSDCSSWCCHNEEMANSTTNSYRHTIQSIKQSAIFREA